MPIFPNEAEEKPNGWTATDIRLSPAPADDTVLSLEAMERAFSDWLSDYKSVQSDAWRELTPDEASILTQAHWDSLLGFYESHLHYVNPPISDNPKKGLADPL